MPIIRGSAGNESPIPKTTSSMFTESGTRKTSTIINRSNFSKASKKSTAKAGNIGAQ